MENLLKFNFLKGTETKKVDETGINLNKNIVQSNNSNEKFLINSDIIKDINKIDSNNLLEGAVEGNKIIKKDKPLDIENNDILAADSNIKINQENLNQGTIENLKFGTKNLTKKNNILSKVNQDLSDKTVNLIEKSTSNKIKKNIDNTTIASNPLKVIDSRSLPANNNINQVFSKIKVENKVKIKSFFKNYINFISKKYTKKNIRPEQNNIINKINLDSSFSKEVSVLNNIEFKLDDSFDAKNKKVNIVHNDSLNKEQSSLNDTIVKDKFVKTSTNFNDNKVDNFDRLKNILDIKTNDIQQRFTQILENNIRLNNNKFEIQLRPENLGRIHISLEISGQNVDININSDNINAIQSLTENNNNLQKMLQSHGMNLNNFNFNGNNSRGKGNSSQNTKKITDEKVSVETEKSITEKDSDQVD